LLGFQEGVKDFVGEDGVFIVEVVSGCMRQVRAQSFHTDGQKC
jgi:hypothetical protein